MSNGFKKCVLAIQKKTIKTHKKPIHKHRWMLGKRQFEITFQRGEILHTHTHTGFISKTHCTVKTAAKWQRRKEGGKESEIVRTSAKGNREEKKKEKTHSAMGFHQHLYKQSVCILEVLSHSLYFLQHTYTFTLLPDLPFFVFFMCS